MRRRRLIKLIGDEAKAQGIAWTLRREGANHTVFYLGDDMIPVPRHNELGEKGSREVLKETENQLGKGWWR